MSDRPRHRLAAILAADATGHSHLMGADEAGTLGALKTHRNTTDTIMLNYGGRVANTAEGVVEDIVTALSRMSGLKVIARREKNYDRQPQ